MTSDSIGKETERMVTGWLRNNGWPGAERRVKTGYRVVGRTDPDQGDITGCVGICWQVKSLRPTERMERAVPKWMAETESQRFASRSSLGFLVVRRWGGTDVGRWWVFQRLDQLTVLATFNQKVIPKSMAAMVGGAIPVRMDMAALAGLLHQTGWAGVEPEELAT